MIVKMERLSAFGMITDKEDILNKLLRKGCVQFITLDKPSGELAAKTKVGEAHTAEYRDSLNRYITAINAIKPYAGKKGLFYHKPKFRYDELESEKVASDAEAMRVKIETLKKEIAELKRAKEVDNLLNKSLIPWISSSLPLETTQTDSLEIAYYILPSSINKQDLSQAMEESAPESHIEYVLEDKGQKYVIAVSHKECSDKTWEALKNYGAVAMHFDNFVSGTPKENISKIEARQVEFDNGIAKRNEELQGLGKNISVLEQGYDSLMLKTQREEINKQLVFTETVFCFSAWVPEDNKPEIEAILNEYGCDFKFEAAAQENDDSPPVLFKNNKFTQTSEGVVKLYGMPSYFSLDPNYVVAPFFALLFGAMLSDAAYGIVLLLGGWLFMKRMDMSKGMKSIVQALMMGGASAIIWGAVFGSWFGDIVTVVAKTFFNADVVMPYVINPMDDPITILIMSLVLGVLHIFAGLGVKAYLMIKRGHFWSAVFDVGFWYPIITGLGLMFVGGSVGNIGMYLAIFGAAGMVLTQWRNKKGIVGKLMGSIGWAWSIVGFLSDILSYSRILAMALSSGVIGSVVNSMGSMQGASVLGALLLLLVFVGGHALNLTLNSFSCFVHTARLQFVEFFGKFFEDGGKPFLPFTANTKYCYVYEE